MINQCNLSFILDDLAAHCCARLTYTHPNLCLRCLNVIELFYILDHVINSQGKKPQLLTLQATA